MLTYETLREYVNREKKEPKLVGLPESFFSEVRAYIKNKASVNQGKEDLWELDNSKRMLSDLMDARENKLVKLALVFVSAGVDPGKVLPEEKEFFDILVTSIRKFQQERLGPMEGETEELATIAAVQDIPKFIGVNMKEYGPLKKGDVARIPKDNSAMLVSKGMAKAIEGK